eukprot:GHVU01014760.1.p1 GENE.GHVU01014760.1~~GHVU01014760.1.p1  ORF type:complete len:235 (+),score=19.09 GHVU01014760.1:453-1157(+)
MPGAYLRGRHCSDRKHPEELQTLLDIANVYSSMERFEIQPTKSMILTYNPRISREALAENPPWTLGPTTIPVVENATHLGIIHDVDSLGVNSTIAQNIQKSRKALYALMGAGLHGKNGLTPKVNLHLLDIYIKPILLHGLEILLPTERQMKPLVKFLEKTIRALLALPDSAATPAVYLVSGTLPMMGKIHLKALTVYRAIISDYSCMEREIAVRQTIMRKPKSRSWFEEIRNNP